MSLLIIVVAAQQQFMNKISRIQNVSLKSQQVDILISKYQALQILYVPCIIIFAV